MSIEGINNDWDLRKCTPEQIEKDTKDLLAKMQLIIDEIVAVSDESCSYETICKPLQKIEISMHEDGSLVDMPQHTHSDKLVRAASSEAEKKLEEFEVSLRMNQELFRKLELVKKTNLDSLTDEQRKFVDKTILKGKRNGLHLEDKIVEEIKSLKLEISELCIKFSSNLNEDDTKLIFTEAQLKGVDEDVISTMKKLENGSYETTIKYDHLFPILRNCQDPETRKKVAIAHNSKCMEENGPLLSKVLSLRRKLAQILGYRNYSSYQSEDSMAASEETISNFLADLAVKFKPLLENDRKLMLELKEKECSELGLDFDGTLNNWDTGYYLNKIEKEKFSIDHSVLKEYFPIDKLLDGMFEIYQNLLSLKFEKVENASVWHDEVSLYRVTDSETKELLGHFYLDLHPRPGKFSHAAVFPLQPTFQRSDGSMQPAVCAMLCNFPRGKPALLTHKEVETLFHEFGHVMHNTCSRATLSTFANTRVHRDFVEAPSQMLENWVWKSKSLALMSGHYKTGAPIPQDLMDQLANSKACNSGYLNSRQVVLAKFDQIIHTSPEDVELNETYSKLSREILNIDAIPKTNFAASFGHLCGGYGAKYYGYLWSEVYSADMYGARFEGHILDPIVGRAYRDIILAPGGSIEPLDLLRKFLGREPNSDAFFRSLGVEIPEK